MNSTFKRLVLTMLLGFALALLPSICTADLMTGAAAGATNISTFDATTSGVFSIAAFIPDDYTIPDINTSLFGVAIKGTNIYYTVLSETNAALGLWMSDGIHACPYNNGNGGHDVAVYHLLGKHQDTNTLQSLAVYRDTVYGLSGYSGFCHPWVWIQFSTRPHVDFFFRSAELGPPAYYHTNANGDWLDPVGFIVLPDNGHYLVQDSLGSPIFREYLRNGALMKNGRKIDFGPYNSVFWACVSSNSQAFYFQLNYDGVMKTNFNGIEEYSSAGGNFGFNGIATKPLVNTNPPPPPPFPMPLISSPGDADFTAAPTNSDTLSSAQRSQQAYSSSQFPPGPIIITALHFRPSEDPYVGPFSTTLGNIQINLSTTTSPPDGLSATFADNAGSDDTLVYSNSLTISSADTGDDSGPRDTDIYIPLQVPFFYDPSQGNLLLDIRHFSNDSTNGVYTSAFDATNDGASRVVSSNPYASTADFSDSTADVVSFTYLGQNHVAVPNYAAYTAKTNVSATLVATQRVQQVYSSLQFPDDSLLITALRFRPAESPFGSAFTNTIGNIQINLSTTTHSPDGLSTTFSNNVGTDDQIVYSGSLTVSSAFTGDTDGPRDSDIVIPLQVPFAYFPTNGNLLLDIRHFSDDSGNGAYTPLFNVTNDCGSRVMSSDPNASTATYSDSGVDMVDFVYQGGGAIVAPNYTAHSTASPASGTLVEACRSQQVYGSSQFPPNPVKISELHFRPAELPYGGAFSTTISSIQINLSTTTNSADGLSSTFANNIGTNDQVVYSGSLHISSAYTGDSVGPRDNDIVIRLQTPFIYDPSQGNLLLDIHHFSNNSGNGAYVECFGENDDAGSRVVSTNPSSSTASFVDTGVDVVKFIYTDE